MSRLLVTNKSFELLEPYEGKLSRTVLRGGAGSNAILLPDQTLENKQRFISQIMTSKSPVRSCDDVDEQALSYAEIKALCAGNPLIKEKMDLDVQVAKLKVLKADHQSQKFRLQDKLLTKFPADIQETNAYIAGVKSDAELAAAHPQEKEGFCGITIKGVAYDEKKTAGERLLLACSELPNSEEKVIGSYRGFELSLRFDTYHSEYQALLKGQRKYPVALGKDPLGCIIRLDNSLNNFPERITSAENELATLKQQQAAAQIEVEKPFPQEEELAEKSARLAELNAQLDMDEKSHEPEQDEGEKEQEPRRSSVLAALEEKADKVEPMREYSLFIRSVLNYANDNYGTLLQMPMIKASGRKSKSVDCLHSDEVEALQMALKECSMLEKAIILCLLNTGVRRGELAGLTWKDVNFREGTIHVSKSLLVFPNYGYQLTTTKESNIRDIDVAPEFMAFLKDYHEQWKSRKKLMGASWQKNLEKKGSKYAQSLLDLRGNDFIICNDYGFPINPDSYAALVRRVGKKAGIEKIHPHMFRHTFVSILLSNPNIGVATVAAEAGHAQPSTTLAIYTQVYDRRRDEIRKQMSMELYK